MYFFNKAFPHISPYELDAAMKKKFEIIWICDCLSASHNEMLAEATK